MGSTFIAGKMLNTAQAATIEKNVRTKYNIIRKDVIMGYSSSNDDKIVAKETKLLITGICRRVISF
jgi:hypothetical protein